MHRLLLSLLLAGLCWPASHIVVKDKDGVEISALSHTMREDGPRAFAGLYITNTGTASTFDISVVSGVGNDLAFGGTGSSCSGEYPAACSGVSYPATIGVGTQKSVSSTTVYTLRIADSNADNSPVDITYTGTIATKTPPPSWTTTGAEQGCVQSDAAKYPGRNDTCVPGCTAVPASGCTSADSDWRPDEESFAPPGVGSSYVDSSFGATVTQLCEDCNHAYSALAAINADGTKAIVGARGYSSGYKVIDMAGNDVVTGIPSPSSTYWDAVDPAVYYYCTDSQGISKVTLNYGPGTHSEATSWIDLSGDFAASQNCGTGGTGDLNSENWIAVISDDDDDICAINLTTQYKTCLDISGIASPFTSIDFILISKGEDTVSGKMYVGVFGEPAMGVWSFDPDVGSPTLAWEYRVGEAYEDSIDYDGDDLSGCPGGCFTSAHSDTYQDAAGVQYYVAFTWTSDMEWPGKWIIAHKFSSSGDTFRMPEEAGGAARYLFALAVGVTPAALHAAGAKSSPWFYIAQHTHPNNNVSTPIIDVTDATPIVAESTGHGVSNDELVNIGDVGGNTAANGVWTAANVTANTLELAGSAGNGAYTSGGILGSGAEIDWLAANSVHRSQQIIFRLGTREEIRRVAMNRGTAYSQESGSGYWSAPRGVISPDGRRILWDANFGAPNQVVVLVAETGVGERIGLAGNATLSGGVLQ